MRAQLGSRWFLTLLLSRTRSTTTLDLLDRPTSTQKCCLRLSTRTSLARCLPGSVQRSLVDDHDATELLQPGAPRHGVRALHGVPLPGSHCFQPLLSGEDSVSDTLAPLFLVVLEGGAAERRARALPSRAGTCTMCAHVAPPTGHAAFPCCLCCSPRFVTNPQCILIPSPSSSFQRPPSLPPRRPPASARCARRSRPSPRPPGS